MHTNTGSSIDNIFSFAKSGGGSFSDRVITEQLEHKPMNCQYRNSKLLSMRYLWRTGQDCVVIENLRKTQVRFPLIVVIFENISFIFVQKLKT